MAEWKRVRLGDVVSVNDEAYSSLDKWEFINYLDTGSVTENSITKIQRLEMGVDEIPSRARRKAYLGDIVYSTVRPNQRHYAILKAEIENLLVSTGFAVLRAIRSLVEPLFIYYYLSQDDVVAHLQLVAEQSVSTYPSLNPSDITNLVLSIPPLATQKKIAAVLGAIDDKIETNRKICANLEAQAQALFKSWFVDFEPFGGKMPKDWRMAPIYDFAEIIYGAPFKSSLFNEKGVGRPIIRIRDLKNNETRTFTTEHHQKEYLVKPGDLIVGMDGEFRPYIWGNSPALLNQRVCVFKPIDNESVAFLLFTIKPQLAHIEATETGTTVIHIGKEDFDAFRICIPNGEHIRRFNAAAQNAVDEATALRLQNVSLASMRDALLPRLMSGEIDVEKVEVA